LRLREDRRWVLFAEHAASAPRGVDGALGLMERLREVCLEAYDRLIGLELSEVAVDGGA
jgi:hypothetical protein